MAKLPVYKYVLCRCNGEIENLRVPSLFSPYEVAERLVHDLVFMHIPRRQAVFCENNRRGVVSGPAVCLIRGGKMYEVERAPVSDGDAHRMFRQLGL